MISLVIPAHNESKALPETIKDILQVISYIPEFADDFEVVVVDDHSDDGTYEFVAGLQDKRIKCLRLSKRSGSHAALRAGLHCARGQANICLSADGQDNPAALTEMLAAWKKGAHIVWALRHNRDDEPLRAKIFARVFYKLLQVLNPGLDGNIDLSRADFYLLDRKVVDALKSCPERNTSLFGLIAWLGFRQESVEYERRKRRHGSSKWSFRSKIRLALDWMVSFSGLPLKMMTLLGFIVSTLGFVLVLFVVIEALFCGSPVQGWQSLFTAILFLGGVQLASLGVLGEYLWRTFDETKKRPLYFIEQSSEDRTF